ncbi:hypothetical protein FisN_20Lh089 [Fistulifera solaris]|uniref:Uncharacterized protein n=1 Tax=Fistulifera solaris TaxID=1519565 RepID=A0A1Z5JCX6_FISSO|nr:hypothetical protein FisN_20Lh089 [Fistulifera solaris]|eukprot:GAX11854.1 hypothetical protein FisN_20Lh089 [Fistulifera solaris]
MSAEDAVAPTAFDYRTKVKENEDLRQRIDTLKHQVQSLKRKCTALEKWKAQLKTEQVNQKKIQSSDTTMVSMEQVQQFLAEYGGLSRYTIVDDEWHNKHPKAANHLLGFPSWEEGKQIMKLHFPDLVQSCPKLYLSRNSKRLQLETGTTLFERCVAVKLMERLGLAASKCGSIYSADERTVKSWRAEWQRRWGIDEIKVFQCQPLLGPSAVKKRKRMNEMAAATEMTVQTDERGVTERNSVSDFTSRPPTAQDVSTRSQPFGHLVNTGHGHDDYLMHQDTMTGQAEERHHEAAAIAPAYMIQEPMPPPPLAAAVAAFIRNNNGGMHPSYRGPYETGGYYL